MEAAFSGLWVLKAPSLPFSPPARSPRFLLPLRGPPYLCKFSRLQDSSFTCPQFVKHLAVFSR